MTTDTSSRTNVLNDFATSYWLKDALKSALNRDIVDALSDAERLVSLLKAEYACAHGEAI